MLGLFHGRPGARTWRRILTVEGAKPGAGVDVIERGLAALADAAARRAELGAGLAEAYRVALWMAAFAAATASLVEPTTLSARPSA